MVDLFRLLDGTFQSAVGVRVLLVVLQVSLVVEVAFPSLGSDVLDVVGRDNPCGEVDEVFTSWLKLETLLFDHWELLGLADEDVERVIFLSQSAKGHQVGVKVKRKSQPVSSSNG